MNVILFMSLIVNLKYTYLIFTATNKQRLKNFQNTHKHSQSLSKDSLFTLKTLSTIMDAPHKYLKARQAEFDRKVEAGIRHFSETGQPIPDVARVPAAEGSSWCLDGSATDTNFGTVDYIVGKYTPKRLAEILLKQQKESRYHRRLNKLAGHDWKKIIATLSEMETKHALSTAHQESLLNASKEHVASLWKQVTDLEPLVERLEMRDEENETLMRLYIGVKDECSDLQEQLKMTRSENEKGLMVTRDLLEEEIGTLQELYSEKEEECKTLREQLGRSGQWD